MNKREQIGEVFERLTIIDEAGKDRHGNRKVRVCCSCGNVKDILAQSLRSGAVLSCGCLHKEHVALLGKKNATHGFSRVGKVQREFISWTAMKGRCLNKNHIEYKRYGAVGVIVCDRWLHSFENFLEDMGLRPVGTSIDRINPYGNYEPSNCRWATADNKRKK